MASGEGKSSRKFNIFESDPVDETETSVRVSVRKKGKYNGEDHMDNYLLNQIAKHVKYKKLRTFARDLEIKDTTYSNIAEQQDQIWQVLSSWMKVLPKNYKVNDLIAEIQHWYDEGYLDDEVWKHLKEYVSSDAVDRRALKPETESIAVVKQTSHIQKNVKLQPEIVRPKNLVVGATCDIKRKSAATYQPQLGGNKKPPEGTIELCEGITSDSSFVTRIKVRAAPVREESGTLLEASKGSLHDEHIVDLSRRITNAQELMDLGIKALKLPKYIVSAAMYNHGDTISEAAHDVLTTWLKRQASRQQAYADLHAGLQRIEMEQLAAQLKKWVKGLEDDSVCKLQGVVKDALYDIWRNCMSNEWLSPERASSNQLTPFYIEPEMVWTSKVVLGLPFKAILPLAKLADIFVKLDSAKNTILVEAGQGMGKSCLMASLARTWIKEPESPVKKFAFVFLIALGDVNETSSLAELVKEKMRITSLSTPDLQMILDGKTNHKILLILDGYNQYIPGTNKHIDKIIEVGIPSGTLIITSTPGNYLSDQRRNEMDAVVKIKGFSEQHLYQWTQSFLGNHGSADMIQLYKRLIENGHEQFYFNPTFLLTLAVLYKERKTQINNQTQLNSLVFEAMTIRAEQKTSTQQNFDRRLKYLDEISWTTLQKHSYQYLLNKEEIERKCPELLQLGLLKTVGQHVSFYQNSLQDLSAARHVVKILGLSLNLKVTLNELFPCWPGIRRHEKVVTFVVGLSQDPRPIVDYIHSKWGELWLGNHPSRVESELRDKGGTSPFGLLGELYLESRIRLPGKPLHNSTFNFYDHELDDKLHRPRDLNRIFTPSKLYWFCSLREVVPCCIDTKRKVGEDSGECGLWILNPDPPITRDLFAICSKISRNQPFADLFLRQINCVDLIEMEELIVSRNCRSLIVVDCILPVSFFSSILHQLLRCETLDTLDLRKSNARDVEKDLDELLESLLKKDQTKLTVRLPQDLSEHFRRKWHDFGVLMLH